MKTEEVWKSVVGWEGKYEISSIGNIRSLSYKKSNKSKELKKCRQSAGYFIVSLYLGDGNKSVKKKRIHRMVAESFIPNPEKKPEVNHKNGVKIDNRVENLEWVTPKENIGHAIKEGFFQFKGKKFKNGIEHPFSKLNDEIVREIINTHKNVGIFFLSQKFGVKVGTIGNVIKRKTWKHVSI